MKEENPRLTLSQFCDDHGLPYDACRVAFRRLGAGTKRERTKTDQMFDQAGPDVAGKVLGMIDSGRVVDLHCQVLSILYGGLARLEELQTLEKNIEVTTANDLRQCVSAVGDMIRALRELLPFITELRDRAGISGIMSRLQSHEIDITQASLEMSKLGVNLPEALKIMLSKTPPVIIANSYEIMPEDELDARALEVLEGVKWQYECFLPERREEVIELKKELGAGSWPGGKEAEPNK